MKLTAEVGLIRRYGTTPSQLYSHLQATQSSSGATVAAIARRPPPALTTQILTLTALIITTVLSLQWCLT
uniref:Uncharacterized protein MANES_08G066900 n=1 Tax=Rhizophora mucronata TaxID=61149 RepID=A0A2P2JSR1_RHIMU